MYNEAVLKRLILFKVNPACALCADREGENFKHPGEIGFAFYRASRNILTVARQCHSLKSFSYVIPAKRGIQKF